MKTSSKETITQKKPISQRSKQLKPMRPIFKMPKTTRIKPVPIRNQNIEHEININNYGKKYTSYRKGLLINVYEVISRYGNFGDKDKFIKDCLNDNDINELLNNSIIDSIDGIGGMPKLLITIYSKYISHKYII